MTQISASNDITVDFSDTSWQLLQQLDDTPAVIAEVQQSQGLQYNKFFATTRNLPTTGHIETADILEVVLGWSYETEAWQLGVILSPLLAEERGSRWCELVRFDDPDLSEREADAKQVGQALAENIGKPFVEMPPSLAPEPEPVPLPDLPSDYGVWTIKQDTSSNDTDTLMGDIELQRSSSWMIAKLKQIAWYGFWAVVYAWVSTATLNNDLALPNTGTLLPDPSILPYLGLGIVVLLLGLIVYHVMIILREPDTIIISPIEQSITASRGSTLRWRYNANTIQSVYATEMLKKRDKHATIYHSELNLHTWDGKFQRVIVEQDKLEDILLPNVESITHKDRGESVIQLDARAAETKLQAVALHIAECLDLPTWHDLRYK